MRERTVPEAVAKRARASGEAGVRWLERIDSLVAGLEADWRICVDDAFTGGTDAYVAPAVSEDGAKCVLRLCIPDETGLQDLLQADTVMLAASGRGYARLLREDEPRLACLLECLGRPLSMTGLPVERQLDILCDTLSEAWIPAQTVRRECPRASLLPDGSGAIGWFREFIPKAWERLDHPLSLRAVEHALECLDGCAARAGSGEIVLVHGDANAPNCLEDPLRPGAFRFIDPDGVLGEKAADLGVLMIVPQEGFADAAASVGETRCRRISERTGVPPEAVWQWGCVQSVSTALVCAEIGHGAAAALARIAEAWAAAEPFL